MSEPTITIEEVVKEIVELNPRFDISPMVEVRQSHVLWFIKKVKELQQEKWYLIDEYTGEKIRGPYRYSETAVAVRHEVERIYPFKEWNLQIVRKE